MPITFEEMVQSVINVVRDREQALALAQKLEARVKELESELAKRPVTGQKPIEGVK